MPSRRHFRWLSTVLALALVSNACARHPSLRITAPAAAQTPQATNESSAPPLITSSSTVSPATGLPAGTPGGQFTPFVGNANYHQPSARSYRGQRPYRFGLLAGSEDAFFATLARGGQQAAANLGIELYAQFPQNWNTTEQVQMLDAFLARGDLDALLVASSDPQALLPSLQKADQAGILLMTIQTGLPAAAAGLPLAAIHTDDHSGGFTACLALAGELIPSAGASGQTSSSKTPTPPKKVYIQKGKQNLFDGDARAQGCNDALTQFPDIELTGEDDNAGDSQKAAQQVKAILSHTPDLDAIFCTDGLCAQAASQALGEQSLTRKVKIAALDADPTAVDLLRQGAIDVLVTPRPADMGYLAVMLATAALDGVTSLPDSFTTGWQTLTPQNLSDPASTRWLYDSQAAITQVAPQRTTVGLKIAFVAGVDDPFYYTMQRGAQQAADSLGATLLTQFPTEWNATDQAQIIDQMVARETINALLLVPTDPLALLSTLQPLAQEGMPILALDTALDPSFAPLSTLRSDDQAGGAFACRSLAQTVGGQGKFYIQNVTPGIATTDAREHGCQAALSQYAGITLVAVNYNDDDPAKAQAQLATVLQNYPDLSAVFTTNVFGAQAVGQYLAGQGLSGKVQVAAFDATAAAIDLLRSGKIDMVVAQEPADMGYLAVLFAAARLDGVTDLPTHLSTGFVLLTSQNMDDPAYNKYFYTK